MCVYCVYAHHKNALQYLILWGIATDSHFYGTFYYGNQHFNSATSVQSMHVCVCVHVRACVCMQVCVCVKSAHGCVCVSACVIYII